MQSLNVDFALSGNATAIGCHAIGWKFVEVQRPQHAAVPLGTSKVHPQGVAERERVVIPRLQNSVPRADTEARQFAVILSRTDADS